MRPRRLFLRHGIALTLTGIFLGVGVTIVVTRVMSALLFGVGLVDPLTYSAVQKLDEIRANSMAQTSFVMVMLVIAGSVALLLGVVGIYGVIA
jgi:ABC-type antimicrobial peptide transport system permease subunit